MLGIFLVLVSSIRYGFYTLTLLIVTVLLNALHQLLPKKKSEPPLVWHWIPFIGNAIEYGTDPLAFYTKCQRQHGPIFTYILFGKKMTVYLGLEGNEFILNGRLQDVNAEDIYGPLTTPVFGPNVIYDCPNSKLMEQKKFVKFGLTQRALEQHVPLIENEVLSYMASSPSFISQSPTSPSSSDQSTTKMEQKLQTAIIDLPHTMAQITIFTAGRALQGPEVRTKLTDEFAGLYDDLDHGFRPINFLAPWLPLPQNWRRDKAHAKMMSVYMDIISRRREKSGGGVVGRGMEREEIDMIDNLMTCVYKSGETIPDSEIACMMITILMAGQHSSSSSSCWIMLHLASRPDLQEELYREQQDANLYLAGNRGLQYQDLEKLKLLSDVVKETLRLHSSIHSVMRAVKNDLPIPGTPYVVTTDKVLIASPLVTHLSPEHFSDPEEWDPYRWATPGDIEKDEEVDYGYGVISKGTRSPYLPFGAGRHRCIGEKFAFVNLLTIIATLVRGYKWSLVPEGEEGGQIPKTDYSSMVSRPMPGSRVRWEKRV
uniref:CYP51A n=2 Tax=Rhynchosporium graminicola TaxID=2792576 RepID=A0A075MG71_9HELO|nr:CYP51A [Rhynchosporium commune]